MFCPNCGNKFKDVGNFCDSCGHNLNKKLGITEMDNKEKDTEIKSADILWKKFLEIVKAEGDEAKRYKELSSDAVWEIIDRFYKNSFNNLTEEFKIDLDKQPYRLVDNIRAQLQIFVLNAYLVYIAEKLLKEKDLKKPDIKDPEILAEEWKRVYLNYNNKIIKLSDDALIALGVLNERLSDSFFEDNSALKDLPKIVVDGIKGQFISQQINGYLLGIAEDNLINK